MAHIGAYGEMVVVPIESVARVPAGSSLVEAATLPMNGLTARLALDLLALRPGQTMAVTGAAGAFGGYVVQLAKAEGLHVIADASPADTALVTSLGADEVVARGDDVADRIRAVVPEGVDALADGALLHAKALPAVRDGGGLAAVRTVTYESERGITIHPVWVRGYAREHAKLDALRQQVEDGSSRARRPAPSRRTPPAMLTAGSKRAASPGGSSSSSEATVESSAPRARLSGSCSPNPCSASMASPSSIRG